MDALGVQLSSGSLTSSVAASSLLSQPRPPFSSLQLGRVGSSPAVGSVSAKETCTADELHYVPVPNSDWRAALWRYLPSPKVLLRYIYIHTHEYLYTYVIMFYTLSGTEEETSFASIVWDSEQCFHLRSFP